ncbi:MAG: hypothetical protein J1E29_04745 [Duncaniella sp.]|nr:hypothetical protein [Duncaniella sp.]
MKKIFTLFAVAAMSMAAMAQDAPLFLAHGDAQSRAKGPLYNLYVTEDDEKYTVPYADGLLWDNGVEMYLVMNDKSYSGGNTNGTLGKPIKLSNGAPNLVVLPDGFKCGKIVFYGYCNNDGEVSYIADISAEVDGALQCVYRNEGTETVPNISRDDFSPMTLEDMPKIVCELGTGVTGNLWFKNGGKQPAFFIELYPGEGTGVMPEDPNASLTQIATEADAPAVYYNLQGVRVENPANGLYIRKQGNTVTKVIL